ncbi:MAG: tail fiber domain-containing protein [Myxococcaceae bacterium]|nr:tail fiber domain-containing protein [Myxococcaceae bacterium]
MRRVLGAMCGAVLVGCSGGAVGPAGPAGPTGPRGDQGATGPAGQSVAVNVLAAGSTDCPTGGVELLSAEGRRVVCNGRDGVSDGGGGQGPAGPPGPAGMTGPAGMQGPAGPMGSDGRSVSIATEPPGANCPAGGIRANGFDLAGMPLTAYACSLGAPRFADGGFVAGAVLFESSDGGVATDAVLRWGPPHLSVPSLQVTDATGGFRGFIGSHQTAPGTSLLIKAGFDNLEARGGALELRAGNAFLSSPVFCNASTCNGTPSTLCPGPENNSVRIYAGDNGVGQGWTCSDLRNGDIEFYAGNGQPERMRIQGNTGNVGIGTATPSQRLQVSGNVLANNVIVPSDARLKEDVHTITRARELLQALKGVHYRWTKDAQAKFGASAGADVGLLAQDVQKVLPEAVVTLPDGTLTVNYDKVMPLLVEALKAQDAKLQQLEASEARLKALEARLEKLERR